VTRLLQTYSFRHAYAAGAIDVFGVLEEATARGYDGVSINVNGPGLRQLSGESPAHVKAVRAALAARHLECDLEISGTDPAFLALRLELCQQLGARHLRTYMRHGGSADETVERTIADLRSAIAVVEHAGIPILVENHEDFTGRELAAILDAVDHPLIGALFDYGNAMMVGEEPLDALTACLRHVRAAHLKDHACLDVEETMHVLGVPIGSGVVPVGEITRRLAAAGCERLIVSNVWGYVAPVRSWRGGGVPGCGSFVASTLHDQLLRPHPLPEDAVALERAALDAGEHFLRSGGIL
jgi:sugar phosphate isomerase/epimerase